MAINLFFIKLTVGNAGLTLQKTRPFVITIIYPKTSEVAVENKAMSLMITFITDPKRLKRPASPVITKSNFCMTMAAQESLRFLVSSLEVRKAI